VFHSTNSLQWTWLQNVIVIACYKKEEAHARDGIKESVNEVKSKKKTRLGYGMSLVCMILFKRMQYKNTYTLVLK